MGVRDVQYRCGRSNAVGLGGPGPKEVTASPAGPGLGHPPWEPPRPGEARATREGQMEVLWSSGLPGVSGDKQHQLLNVALRGSADPRGADPGSLHPVPPELQARGQNKTCPCSRPAGLGGLLCGLGNWDTLLFPNDHAT